MRRVYEVFAMTNNVIVSVIITGKNAEKTIEKAIRSLLDQTLPHELYEIIYVDGGSTDNTLSIIRRFKNRVHIYVHENSTPGSGRNYGAKYAKGKYLAFLDADCMAPQNWLSTLLTAIRSREDIGAVGAALIDPQNKSKFNRLFYKTLQTKLVSLGSAQFYKYRKMKTVRSLPAGNFMTTREIFNELGGFSEDLRFCEDTDFHYRLRKMGYNLIYVPNAEVIHLKEINSLRELIKYIYRWGCGRAQAAKRRKYLLTPIYIGLLVAFTIFMIVKIALFLAYLFDVSYIIYELIDTTNTVLDFGILAYLATMFINSIMLSYRQKSIYYVRSFYVGLVTHLAYIVGFLACFLLRE